MNLVAQATRAAIGRNTLNFLPSRQVQRAINRHLAKRARHEEEVDRRVEKRFGTPSQMTRKTRTLMLEFRELHAYPEALSLEDSRSRH